MSPKDRLSYYKSLKRRGIGLNGTQQSDYLMLVSQLGEASVEAMPHGTAKHELARQQLG